LATNATTEHKYLGTSFDKSGKLGAVNAQMPLSRAMRAAVNRVLADRATDGNRTTAKELAQMSGLPYRSLSRRLDGKVDMDPDSFERIAVALGVDVDALWRLARQIQDERPSPEAIADDALSQLAPEAQAEIAKVSKDLRPKRANDPPAKLGREA
jgi:transcriptional regulator with XRE-family HTH domain